MTASANPAAAVKGEIVTLTAAPDAGYRFKEWQSTDITVTDNKFTMPAKAVTVTAVFEAIPTSPQTGDTSNMFLWIALLLVSGGALVGTTVYSRKKKYKC